MKSFNSYIIEKLKINKDTKVRDRFTQIEEIINDFFLKSKLKYKINILNIQKQSLYTRSDWGDDNFLRLEILSYITNDRFKKILLDIKDIMEEKEIEGIYIGKGDFLPENGKRYGIKYIDYLIKKDEKN